MRFYPRGCKLRLIGLFILMSISLGEIAHAAKDSQPVCGRELYAVDRRGGITGSLTLTGPDAAEFRISKAGDSLDVIYSPVPEPAGTAVMLAVAFLADGRRRKAAKPLKKCGEA